MKSSIRFLLFLPILFSCSEKQELIETSEELGNNISAEICRVTLRSDSPSECVYIFREEEGMFRYNSKVDSGWSEDGKVITRLRMGKYKFLFTSSLSGQLDIMPASMDKTVTIDQLRFVSWKDAVHGQDYILSTGDFFLPEPNVVDSIYTIRGGDEIECTLHRRVSQLVFALNRGYKEGNEYISQPFEKGHDIFDIVKEVHVEIYGVARECNYLETSGEGKVCYTYSATDNKDVDAKGFATLEGPFVFPPTSGGGVRLIVSLVSITGSPYPPLHLTGTLEANRKLKVNLWLNSSSFDIGVNIHNLPISERTEGDYGIWE